MVRLGADRRSWLAFCAGVEHATHVAEAIRARGFSRRHDLRRHPEARARPDDRRLQARRDQGARLDGRADHRLQRAGRRSHRHAAADEVDRALRADGRPRHPARARQGRLPGARLRRQRRAPRADRRGEAEAPRRRRGRGAGQGLPRLPEHPRDRGPGLPRLRPRLPAAEGPGRAGGLDARDPHHRQAAVAARSMASATAPTRSPAAARRCRSTTSAVSPATANGSASSTPATPGRRPSPGGASGRPACRCRATVTEALAWSRQIAAPTEIAVRPSGRFTEIVSVRFAPCPALRRLPPRAARLRLVRRPLQGPRPPPRPHPPPALQPRPARTSAIGDAA